jgi:hypothetical protein
LNAAAARSDWRLDDERAELWASLGASAAEADELCSYARNVFDFSRLPAAYPLPDEPFVAAWQSYVADARVAGALPALRERLIQLRFPVEEGISSTERYRAATRRGRAPEDGAGLELEQPAKLRLLIHPTPAGRVPIIVAGTRRDFELLLLALTRRNEPGDVPASTGACIVSGYNNWDRIRELRRRRSARAPTGTRGSARSPATATFTKTGSSSSAPDPTAASPPPSSGCPKTTGSADR